jgi:integrase/recombinase XerD
LPRTESRSCYSAISQNLLIRSPISSTFHSLGLNPVDLRAARVSISQRFTLLIQAAKKGKQVEAISGPDRAILYILAAWTAFRKGELGSLTKNSLRLDEDPPTATVAASYSKRRREDTQVLHPDVVALLREWLKKKFRLKPTGLLFPISGKVPGGTERKTFKMIARDLAAARKAWIKEAKTPRERREREKSDFLAYKSQDGLFADFHSLRHKFITSLEQSGVSPKTAQTLARHSDIRLTLGVYTHVALHDQAAVIASLPGPEPFTRVEMSNRVAG